MKHVNVSELVVGQAYAGIYILLSHAVKTTKQGSEYMDMVLSDKTGELPAKLWTIPSTLNADSLVDGDFIAVGFTVESYLGKNQAKIDDKKIRKLSPEDVFDKSEIVPCAPIPVEDMMNEILDAINNMKDKELQRLTSRIIMDKGDTLMWMPGAKSVHHNVVGGLLYHMLGMLRLGMSICNLYPSVNKDLLMAGILLHDICKIREYEAGPTGMVTDYSIDGKLLGHITMGVAYIETKCKEMHIGEEYTRCIEHMILSHHGKPEYGSAIEPMFLEAFLLNMIDNIDAKVYCFNDIYSTMENGTVSDRHLGTPNSRVYKPAL